MIPVNKLTQVLVMSTDNYLYPIPFKEIVVSGAKAREFLQGQLTCNLNKLAPGQVTMGSYCDRKGKVQASFILYCEDDTYKMLLHESIVADTITLLHKYGVFAKIQFNVSSKLIYCIYSDASVNLPKANEIIIQAENTIISYPIAHMYLVVTDNIANLTANLRLINNNIFWDEQHIAHGLVQIEAKTKDLFTPAMLNYQKFGAVSINKGCYLGQEIIMRSAKLGNVKRGLFRYVYDHQEFNVGDKLPNDIGSVVAAQHTTGLAVVPFSAVDDCPVELTAA
jgi:folate-binding protein YgfZ